MLAKVIQLIADIKKDVEYCAYCNDMESHRPGRRTPAVRNWLVAFEIIARHCFYSRICRLRGHRLTESGVSVENGTSRMSCSRCGEDWDVQW
jgi:hypothetical protein